MTFTAVSTLVDTATTTLAVNPMRVGNFYLAEIITNSNTVYCNSITGGNCTWTLLTSFKGHNNSTYASVFTGVATATGSANATLAFSGTTPTFEAVAQQFSSSVGSWALATSGTLDLVTGTNTWPSLTPDGPGNLYFGFFYDSGTATAGSTVGFTYTSYAGDGVAYNPGCGSGAQAPVWGDSGSIFGIAVLLAETPSTSLPRAIQAKIPRQKQFPSGLVYGSAPASLSDQFGSGFGLYFGVPGFSSSYSTGRISANLGTLPENPTAGPVFIQATAPIRARLPQPSRTYFKGRVYSNKGALVRNPATGPAFIRAVKPARAVIPRVFSKGRVSSSPGAPVRNPAAGPAFRQKTYPARIRPSLPPRGRISLSLTSPPFIPQPGPVFRPFRFPVRVHPVLPPRGRVTSNPGGPLRNPLLGPVFRQKPSPARVHPVLPPRGRVGFNSGTPVFNPTPGPVFYQKTSPVRAVVPQVFSRGRGYSGSPGGPYAVIPKVYQYIGHVPVYYLDYLDGYLKATLYAVPGGEYWILVANTRKGLTIPPADGNWIDPNAQQAAEMDIPLHRKLFLKLREHIHRSRGRSGYHHGGGQR